VRRDEFGDDREEKSAASVWGDETSICEGKLPDGRSLSGDKGSAVSDVKAVSCDNNSRISDDKSLSGDKSPGGGRLRSAR